MLLKPHVPDITMLCIFVCSINLSCSHFSVLDHVLYYISSNTFIFFCIYHFLNERLDKYCINYCVFIFCFIQYLQLCITEIWYLSRIIMQCWFCFLILGLLHYFRLQFNNAKKRCINEKRYTFDDKTVDVSCDTMVINEVFILGDAVQSLCDMLISLGMYFCVWMLCI